MLVQLVDRLGQGSRVSHECPSIPLGSVNGRSKNAGRCPKKHTSNKSLSSLFSSHDYERNRTFQQSRQFIAKAARLSSRAAFVCLEQPHRAEGLPNSARHRAALT